MRRVCGRRWARRWRCRGGRGNPFVAESRHDGEGRQPDEQLSPRSTEGFGPVQLSPVKKRQPRSRPVRRRGLTIISVCVALLGSACGEPPHVPPEGLPRLFEAVEAAPAQYESELDGCVQVHHVWKAKIRAVHLTARGSVADRVASCARSVWWEAMIASAASSRRSMGNPGWSAHNLSLVFTKVGRLRLTANPDFA